MMIGLGWIRLTGIINDELEKFRLNFLRCGNLDLDLFNDSSFRQKVIIYADITRILKINVKRNYFRLSYCFIRMAGHQQASIDNQPTDPWPASFSRPWEFLSVQLMLTMDKTK